VASSVRCSRLWKSLALATVLALSRHASRVSAAPGDLDTDLGGFGVGGKINVFGFSVNAMVLDAEGRLVLAGGQNGEFHVQRRSGNRFLTVEDAPILFGESLSNAQAVAIATDGKIVLAGFVKTAAGAFNFAVARLNTDLTLDPTFAGTGLLASAVDGDDNLASAVAVQSDGKVVVAGSIRNDDTSGDWAVERYNEDGTPDSSFDDNGKRRLGYDAILNDVAGVFIQDGKILLGGSLNDDFGLARLTAEGEFDQSFGSLGDTITGFGGLDDVRGMAIAPDGKIVLGGYGGDDKNHVAVYSPDGFLDEGFGDGGSIIVPGTFGVNVAVQPDGKVITVGFEPSSLTTVRFKVDGDPDETFGEGAGVTTPFPQAALAQLAAVQSDGMIIVAGPNSAVRYRWDGTLDSGGIMTVTFEPEHAGSEVTALAVGDDGKLVAVGKAFVEDYSVAVARFQAPYFLGLDTGFGSEPVKTGRTLFGESGRNEELRAAIVEDDGDVLAAGQVTSQNQGDNFLVARVKNDGTPDPACSADGLGSADFSSSADTAAAVAIDAGKILAAGTGRGTTTADDYGLMRFTAACTEDTFGSGMRADAAEILVNLGGDDSGAGMVVQSGTGLPVMAGTSAGNIALIRIREATFPDSGFEMDPSFATGGTATLDTGGNEAAVGLAEQSDGSLIVAGTVANGADSDFLVARFTANGDLDTTFGVDGVALASFNAADTARALAVRGDDTIAVAGTTNVADGSRFAVAQFVPEGFLDPSFADLAGKVTLRLGAAGDDAAQAVAFIGNNRLVLGGYSTVFGIRQFALAALKTTPEDPNVTTTTTITTTTTTTSTTSSTTTTLPASACGDPVGFSIVESGSSAVVTSSDALFVLRAAVGSETCELCVCDVDDSSVVAASDALLTLKVAVGQPVTLTCPACAG
jgi:uncharacterized delta-60 repeat protein